jgi:hypothetical protein
LNRRPLGYEPRKLPTALPCYIDRLSGLSDWWLLHPSTSLRGLGWTHVRLAYPTFTAAISPSIHLWFWSLKSAAPKSDTYTINPKLRFSRLSLSMPQRYYKLVDISKSFLNYFFFRQIMAFLTVNPCCFDKKVLKLPNLTFS